MLSEQQQRIMGYFIEEAKDHLNTIEQGLLNLQATIEDPEMVHEVFRAAHSVKGGAAMLGLTSIQHTAHRLEDYFKILKECPVKIDQKLESLLLRVYDTLGELLEQLQSPFGLTDDKAEAAMATVEPVFTELNQHLSQLVAESGAQPPEDVSLTELAATTSQPAVQSAPSSQPVQVTREESALRFIFQNDIPAQLREMLQLFKQTDTPETRQQLQSLCRTMAQSGEQLDLPDWCILLNQAEQAIANSENTYRTLAPVIIKDIKRAQEQILTGLTNVAASAELLDLLPAPLNGLDEIELDGIEFNEIEFDEINTEQLDSNEFDLFASDDTATDEATSDDAFAAMFGSELSDDLSGDLSDTLFNSPSTLNSDSSDDLDFALNFDSAQSEQSDFDAVDQTLDLNLFDPLNGELNEAAPASGQQVGPDVGMAELNSLADLFEGEESDLGLNWQEEVISDTGNSAPESLELDDTSDLSDLLWQDSSEELVLDEPEDLSELLNYDIQPAQSTELDELSEFDLAEPDIFADLPESTDLQFELPSEQSDPAQSLFSELTPDTLADPAIEPASDLQNIEQDADQEVDQDVDQLFADLDLPAPLDTAAANSGEPLTGELLDQELSLEFNLEPTSDAFGLPTDQDSSDLPDSHTDLADEFDFADLSADFSELGDLELPGEMSIDTTPDLTGSPELELTEFELPNLSIEQGLESPEPENHQPLHDPWDSLEFLPSDDSSFEAVENPFTNLSSLSSEEALFTQAENSGSDSANIDSTNIDNVTPSELPALEQLDLDQLDLDELNDSTSGLTADFDTSVNSSDDDDLGFSSFSFEQAESTPVNSTFETAEIIDFDQNLELSADEAETLDFAFAADPSEADPSELDLDLNGAANTNGLELNFDDSTDALSQDAASQFDFDLLAPPEANTETLEFVGGDIPADLNLFAEDQLIEDQSTAEAADLTAAESNIDSDIEPLSVEQLMEFELDDEFSEADSDLLPSDLSPSDLSLNDLSLESYTEPASDQLEPVQLEPAQLDQSATGEIGLDADLAAFFESSISDSSTHLAANINADNPNTDTDADNPFADQILESDLFETDFAAEPTDQDSEALLEAPEASFDFDLDLATDLPNLEPEPAANLAPEADSQADFNFDLDDLSMAEISSSEFIPGQDDPAANDLELNDLDLLDLDFASAESAPKTLAAGELAAELPEELPDELWDELSFDFTAFPNETAAVDSETEQADQDLQALDFDFQLDEPSEAELPNSDQTPFEQAPNLGFADLDQFEQLEPINSTFSTPELDLADAEPDFELPDLSPIAEEAELELPEALTSNDALELDSFDTLSLDSSSPQENQTEQLDGFESLLNEAPTTAASAELTELADLEAMLVQEAPTTDVYEDDAQGSSDDFADLEALLEDPPAAAEQPAEAVEPIESTSISSLVEDDEFSDLEALLQDADQMLGIGSSPTRKPATASNRMRRLVRGLNEQTMRVSVKHLDNLNNLVGEMVVNRNSLEQAEERLRQFLDNLLYQVQQLSDVGQRMRDLYERSLLESSLLSSRRSQQGSSPVSGFGPGQVNHATGASFDALEMDRFTGFHTLSQEMIELIVRVRESASDIDFVVEETDQVTRNFRQITTQLQEGLTRSRMVPFSQTADRLPRGIRDNSLKYGKQAELIIDGRDTLIDKMLVELLYDPMTHLVNNAIAHGIETPQERVAAGKSPTGRITIRAFHQGNQTVISVSDDGAGINLEAVKAKALDKGLITPAQANEMSRLDIYDLLFHHGFSTADQVDDLRGRGVGLDVVRSNLNEIRGTISIDSTLGKGTTFTIRLPLTLSISKALCCISNRARIAFPMDGVEDMLDVPKERIQTDEQGRQCIQWRDSLLPFQPLSELLRHSRVLGRGSVYGGNQEEDMISIVVLRSSSNFLALQVDQVLGEQEIVIKQLEGPVPKPLGVAGATVLGDGRIMPIADVLELIDLWQGRIRRESSSSLWDNGEAQLPPEPVTKTEPTVLIVDDSITVRELLSMTFNKVGYRVEQARDGQEAWEKLRAGLPCDLVFCDIEMPRMDGLELLSRIQKDPNLNHLPIAMLTSRGADRHRQMAVQLGAKGYFTKPYLEEVLLDAAQRMLKGEVMISRAT